MKIRTNYVSNSSSSSFVVVCKEVGLFKDLNKLLLEKDKTYFILGDWLDEGLDFIQFSRDDSLCNFMKEHTNVSCRDTTVYQLLDLSEDQVDLSRDLLKKIMPGDKVIAINVDIDYHSTENVSDFKERYLEED